ncbi:MAG: 4Fe-4S binding protein [Butyrivibrio sp.]|jgi:polyferredoxin|nr:4Fe-4S binding protein [Butyrivibrio sp.]
MRKNIRLWFQAAFFALTNGYVTGFTQGKIYTGKAKYLCAPGLNCYSCPGALMSCPIGSLQAVLDGRGFALSCYVFGFLMAFGALFGRFICGWMCPFGLVQDLLYRIPVRHKHKNLPGHRYLKNIKYVILALFVILLPSVIVNAAGVGSPWFCEWICPSGTLLGGIPLVLLNSGLRNAVGFRFAWKTGLLTAILLFAVFYYRPFCKYLCPLGGFYGFFNPIAAYRFHIDQDSCTKCGACQRSCKMDIRVFEQPNSMECIRCGDCMRACPHHAIHSTAERIIRQEDGKS